MGAPAEPDRSNGLGTAALVLAALAVVVAGGIWWRAAAPPSPVPAGPGLTDALIGRPTTPAIPTEWMQAAGRAVSSRQPYVHRAGPIVVVDARGDVRPVTVEPGMYDVEVACAGAGHVAVLVSGGRSAQSSDSAVDCQPEAAFTLVEFGATGRGEVRVEIRGNGRDVAVVFWRVVAAEPVRPEWFEAAQQALPDRPDRIEGGVARLLSGQSAGPGPVEIRPLPAGEYLVEAVCVGTGVAMVGVGRSGGSYDGSDLVCDGRLFTWTFALRAAAGPTLVESHRVRGSAALVWQLSPAA